MPEIRQEGDTMGEFLGKRVIPRHEGDWSGVILMLFQ